MIRTISPGELRLMAAMPAVRALRRLSAVAQPPTNPRVPAADVRCITVPCTPLSFRARAHADPHARRVKAAEATASAYGVAGASGDVAEQAQLAELTAADLPALAAFYDGLSHASLSPIKTSTCVYIREDEDARRVLCEAAQAALDNPHKKTLCMWAGSGSARRIIAVSRIEFSPDEQCRSVGTAVADDWQGRGVATELRRVQLRLARAAGATRMWQLIEGDAEALVRTYVSAARELGLRCTVTTRMFFPGVPGPTEVVVDLRDAPALPPGERAHQHSAGAAAAVA